MSKRKEKVADDPSRTFLNEAEAAWYALKLAGVSSPPFVAGMNEGQREWVRAACARMVAALEALS